MKNKLTVSKLTLYDILLYMVIALPILWFHPSQAGIIAVKDIILTAVISCLAVTATRTLFGVYRQIWRYGSMKAYLCLIAADITASVIYVAAVKLSPFGYKFRIVLLVSVLSIDLLAAIICRMVYYMLYQISAEDSDLGGKCRKLLVLAGTEEVERDFMRTSISDERRIRVAIVGTGRLANALAEDMLSNPESMYKPVCFIDNGNTGSGRSLGRLAVFNRTDATPGMISELNVQEIIFAVPNLDSDEKNKLYAYYRSTGCRLKVYDYPITRSAKAGRIQIRDFDIEELLPRRTISMESGSTAGFYAGKTVLVTGGGGSIGSELCRQIAAMKPKHLIVLDFAENTTYSLQQELLSAYGNELRLSVEICSVTDISALDKVFRTYRPDIVLHAAAHKHVPMMEHNCCEAVKNNVFGTKNVIDRCIIYDVENFTLISSDKAVNPTNVMGGTKRLCEIVMQCAAKEAAAKTKFCAVRFGNVMGSAGSVIPLFKSQIVNGGPVTVTDKRIIRYFMTISEASHLVLEAGANAHNGELFVLDMGEPVKILELAENMIRLSGYKPYEDIDIIETGLRPGEKLYEELLTKSGELTKTDNNLIFIERDEPISAEYLETCLASLKNAISTEDDLLARAALKEAVPTFRDPEYYNSLKR